MRADYILPGLVAAYMAWRVLSSFRVRRRVPALLRDGAQMVDVRSLAEFAGGHAPGSVNIPLPEVDQRIRELNPGRWVNRLLRVRDTQCARAPQVTRPRL